MAKKRNNKAKYEAIFYFIKDKNFFLIKEACSLTVI